MASSDVFDLNFAEIDAWLFFLLSYEDKRCLNENTWVGASIRFLRTVIPFLCDAISVVGNNLYKYQEHTLIIKSAQFEGTIFFWMQIYSSLKLCSLYIRNS
jgi:nucleolar pre-ribosomal-associated protein 1